MVRTLVLIDCQLGFENPAWGARNNSQFENNAQLLLKHWRNIDSPVVHVRHASQEAGSPLAQHTPGFAYMKWAEPLSGEREVVKNVNSGFIGTDLEAMLRASGNGQLVLAGLTTNHCVSTTTRMAGNLGFKVDLVGDACAAFDRTGSDGEVFDADLVHRTALASLHEEFCTVVTTMDAISQQ